MSPSLVTSLFLQDFVNFVSAQQQHSTKLLTKSHSSSGFRTLPPPPQTGKESVAFGWAIEVDCAVITRYNHVRTAFFKRCKKMWLCSFSEVCYPRWWERYDMRAKPCDRRRFFRRDTQQSGGRSNRLGHQLINWWAYSGLCICILVVPSQGRPTKLLLHYVFFYKNDF